MATFRKVYLEELARIQDRINSLFEQAMLSSEFEEREGGVPGTWAPAVDVIETAEAFLIYAELSGVRREDVQLQVKDGRLEISGRRQPLGENRNFLRMERSYGPFRRLIELGAAGTGSVNAAFEQGILRVEVRKQGMDTGDPAGGR